LDTTIAYRCSAAFLPVPRSRCRGPRPSTHTRHCSCYSLPRHRDQHRLQSDTLVQGLPNNPRAPEGSNHPQHTQQHAGHHRFEVAVQQTLVDVRTIGGVASVDSDVYLAGRKREPDCRNVWQHNLGFVSSRRDQPLHQPRTSRYTEDTHPNQHSARDPSNLQIANVESIPQPKHLQHRPLNEPIDVHNQTRISRKVPPNNCSRRSDVHSGASSRR